MKQLTRAEVKKIAREEARKEIERIYKRTEKLFDQIDEVNHKLVKQL
jgi:hypothetical protein